MITKQDMILLADMFRDFIVGLRKPASSEGATVVLSLIANEVEKGLVSFCKASNPRFEADLWVAYLRGQCGPNGGQLKKEAKRAR